MVLIPLPSDAEQKIYYGDGAGYGIDDSTVIINQRDAGGDLKLQFGNTLGESLLWDSNNLYFSISDNMSFGGNQLLDFRMENASSAPTCDGTKNGRMYHNTLNDLSYACDGLAWNRIDNIWSQNGNDAYYSTGKVGIGINPAISTSHIYENTTAVDSTAGVTIEQVGTGDAIIQFLLTGVQRWVMGVDNSDGDKFKISTSADLDTNTVVTIDTSGNIGVGNATPAAKLNITGGILSDEISLSASATIAIDWNAGNQQEVILNQAGHTITFSNVTKGQILRLILCQDATGSRTVGTWPTEMKWAGGVTPVLTTTASQCDVVSFIATNARGTLEIFGNIAKNF